MALENLERKDRYTEVFAHPETLELQGGRVNVVDLQPEHLKTPVPLIIEGGWLGNIPTWEKNARLFADMGRRVIIVGAPHGITPNREDPDLPLAELRKAEAFVPILDAKGIEEADVLTHSEGGVFMTAAALEHPERIRTLVYYAPVGLIGDDGFWKLAWRFLTDMKNQADDIKKGKGGAERKEQDRTGLMPALKILLSSPLQSLKEVLAMAGRQTQENIRALHDKGVKIIIMHPVNDAVSPIDRMAGTAEGGGIVKADMVDGFLSVGDPSLEPTFPDAKPHGNEISDTHNSVFLSPRQYSVAIDSLLDTMERNIAKKALSE